MSRILTIWILCLAGLISCAKKPDEAPPLAQLQAETAAIITPAVVEIRAAVQTAKDEAVPELPRMVDPVPLAELRLDPEYEKQLEIDRLATALIVRWEITSEKTYIRKYQGVICPGGASGPTRGIGWDDGHQTPRDIATAWFMHPQLDRITPASGQVGEAKCRAYRIGNRDIVTPYPMAEKVFKGSSLPAYCRGAERTYGAWIRSMSAGVNAALCSVQYNRGGQTVGPRNIEKRNIRDKCSIVKTAQCVADELVSMCRLWAGTKISQGLCDRRKDEARVALL